MGLLTAEGWPLSQTKTMQNNVRWPWPFLYINLSSSSELHEKKRSAVSQPDFENWECQLETAPAWPNAWVINQYKFVCTQSLLNLHQLLLTKDLNLFINYKQKVFVLKSFWHHLHLKSWMAEIFIPKVSVFVLKSISYYSSRRRFHPAFFAEMW